MKAFIVRLIAASVILIAAMNVPAPAEEAAPAPTSVIEATTAAGEKVMLHPNGRWEYANSVKAAEAKKIANTYPENHARPVDAQGCLFGLGRCIMPGDKDYNRGSLGRR
jgi:hypothetical protein